MPTKKILYIVTQSEFGGAQRYIYDLAVNLANEFKIVVAAGEDPNGSLFSNLRKLNLSRCKTIYLKHLKRAINPWNDVLAFFELRNLIKKEKPSIIHLNSSKAGIIGSLAAKFSVFGFQFLIIYTVHGWVFNEPLGWLRKQIYFYTEKWTARFKDKIICVSEYDRQIAIKNGFPKEKLITIHNGIDIQKLEFLNKQEALKELKDKTSFGQTKLKISTSNQPFQVIGTIANLYATKGIKYLIEAVKEIFSHHPSTNHHLYFLVIGEGPGRQKLEKLIKKYNLKNNFFLLGYLPNAYKYLNAFDIFVLPSVKEGLPYAILEAMAAGLPIIASEVGGLSESLANDMLVKPQNPQQLAEKIMTLLKDESLRKKLIADTKERLTKNFSLDSMIRKTKEVYNL